jgi:hypothetical protein
MDATTCFKRIALASTFLGLVACGSSDAQSSADSTQGAATAALPDVSDSIYAEEFRLIPSRANGNNTAANGSNNCSVFRGGLTPYSPKGEYLEVDLVQRSTEGQGSANAVIFHLPSNPDATIDWPGIDLTEGDWPGFKQGILSATLHSSITRSDLPDGGRRLHYDLFARNADEFVYWTHDIVTLDFDKDGKLTSIDGQWFESTSITGHIGGGWSKQQGVSCKVQ